MALRVAFVSSEVQPFSKTGGLADVSSSLPAALASLGVEITVFTPYYRCARDYVKAHGISVEECTLPGTLWIGNERHPVRFATLRREGLTVVFVVNEPYYNYARLYTDENGTDYPHNVARFAFFCRAILERWIAAGEAPDIFHVNDWQSALIPVYVKSTDTGPLFFRTRTLLTIHNLGYQGVFPAEHIDATGLSRDLFHIEGLEFYGKLNLLKGGIVFADALNTVSPSYAKEIQSAEFGHGLDGLLRANAHKLSGILNGIDPALWNPATDPHLPANYSADAPDGKRLCKTALQKRMNLAQDPGAFLIGAITRFDVQKGTHLLVEAMRDLQNLNVQLAILGSGAPQIERDVRALAAERPERVACRFGFDETLAHLIEAGADAFVMPSLYEPCGLNQMYSQRYGTLPIVRATGGLRDTVRDASPEALRDGSASGFCFDQFSAVELGGAIRRALDLFEKDPVTWSNLRRRVMQIDHSWTHRAQAYVDLYSRLLASQ